MADRCPDCRCKIESGYHEDWCPVRGGKGATAALLERVEKKLADGTAPVAVGDHWEKWRRYDAAERHHVMAPLRTVKRTAAEPRLGAAAKVAIAILEDAAIDWRARALEAAEERDAALDALAPFVADWDDKSTEAFNDHHATRRKYSVKCTMADVIRGWKLVRERVMLKRSGK